jgi:salicylate hydroxylase
MAVEDGAVLGALFSHLRDVDQIRPLMDAFQELRQKRCQALHLSELKNSEVNWLPPSPDRDARDKRLRSMSAPPILGHQQEEAIGEEGNKASTGWDEGRLREEWERVGGMFGYEAKEAAEDWWVHWGTLRESSKEIRAFDPLDLRVQVTRVTKIEDDYTQQF